MQLILSEQFNTAADHLPMTASAVMELLTEWVHPGQLSLWLTNLTSSSYPSLQSYKSLTAITTLFQTTDSLFCIKAVLYFCQVLWKVCSTAKNRCMYAYRMNSHSNI